MNTKYYKKYIEKVISADPATIIITRKTAADDGFGGKVENTAILEPQTIRIYNKKAQREVVSDKGTITAYYSSTALKFVATGSANIEQEDMFKLGEKTLRVAFLDAYMDVCKQGELEVIK